jgi:hypothetical protein
VIAASGRALCFGGSLPCPSVHVDHFARSTDTEFERFMARGQWLRLARTRAVHTLVLRERLKRVAALVATDLLVCGVVGWSG